MYRFEDVTLWDTAKLPIHFFRDWKYKNLNFWRGFLPIFLTFDLQVGESTEYVDILRFLKILPGVMKSSCSVTEPHADKIALNYFLRTGFRDGKICTGICEVSKNREAFHVLHIHVVTCPKKNKHFLALLAPLYEPLHTFKRSRSNYIRHDCQYQCSEHFVMEVATVKAEATTRTWLKHTQLNSTLNLATWHQRTANRLMAVQYAKYIQGA